MYGSEHKLFNISVGKAGEDVVHAVSGRHCESGDLLVKDAMLPSDTMSGDILMSTSTGAYTFAMASNYNRVPKSGVVAVTSSGVVELVNRQRQEFDSKVHFKISVLEYKGNESWIEDTIFQIKKLLDQDNVPGYLKDCDYCTYILDINTVL